MQLIINDSSVLIDIKKGGLLEIFLALPFTLVVSDELLADELLSFTKAEISIMRRKMRVDALSGDELMQVTEVQRTSPALSLHDCAAFVLAQKEAGCILLTGDRRLRAKAEKANIECHGVLWAVEEIAKAELTTSKKILKALEIWHEDTLVRLPKNELAQMIARFKK